MLFTLQSENKNPSILKPFDKKFELQLPLKHYRYSYQSDVQYANMRAFGQYTMDNTRGATNYNVMFNSIFRHTNKWQTIYENSIFAKIMEKWMKTV